MNTDNKECAIVLLSGGLDSTTVLAIALEKGYEVIALCFDYGQKNSAELSNAKAIAEAAGVKRCIPITIDLRVFGASSLTDERTVEKERSFEEIGAGIPATYVPARNTLFLSYALSAADAFNANHIFIGVNNVDCSGYPDCRPEFIQAYETMANLGTRSGVEGKGISIHAPLQTMNKSEIIKTGIKLSVDYSKTSTCYEPLPTHEACGACDACRLRQQGFFDAGYLDPAPYANRMEAPADRRLRYPYSA